MGFFENFKYVIKDYQDWCFENNQTAFEDLKNKDCYNPLEIFELIDCICENDDCFDCYEDFEELKTNEFDNIVIFLIPDINHYSNSDDIRNYLKSDSEFNYLEFQIDSNSAYSQIEKLESFILEHCK